MSRKTSLKRGNNRRRRKDSEDRGRVVKGSRKVEDKLKDVNTKHQKVISSLTEQFHETKIKYHLTK